MGRFCDDPRIIAKADGATGPVAYSNIVLAASRIVSFLSSTTAVPYFGASEARIFSKRGSPRSVSQKGRSFN